jgi:hypothetical protein
MKRLMREPLVHFFLLAAIIFAAYGLFAGSGQPTDDRIEVTQAKVEQLAGLFQKVWQRPPTQEELKGLVDDHVKEEILVREAVRLGLDEDDTIIRRRLRLKMEFLGDAIAEATQPTDSELSAYLERNAEKFREPPRIAFEQVYINESRRGARARPDAEAILVSLQGNAADAASAGDTTLLPAAMEPSDQRAIAGTFGAEFAQAIAGLVPGNWQGPIASSLGLHLVRVTEQVPGRLPSLEEIKAEVAREWMNERRAEAERQRFDELLTRYKVTIEPGAASGGATQ